MLRALALARRGAGRVSPNPLVGAVVAQEGKILGEGYHLFEKRDHAEVVALRRAGQAARGSDLYVNLEPCCHQGRTPPCSELILKSGIRRVFSGLRDPNPLVSGKGLQWLQAQGVLVHEGLCRQQAEVLNEKFLHFAVTGRPFVLLKLALSLDGRLATRSGDSQWITGSRSRAWSHRLRYEYDAILVGIHTVLHDDPSLDVRWKSRNAITKVVLDSRLRTPPGARLFESDDPVIIFHARGAARSQKEELQKRADLLAVPRREDRLSWKPILEELGRRRASSLLVEGGAQIAASLLKAGLVQKMNLFYGAKIIGSEGLPAVGSLAVQRLEQAIPLRIHRMRRLDSDVMVEAYLPA